MKGTAMNTVLTVRTDTPHRVLTCPPNVRHGGTVEWVAPQGADLSKCPTCGRTTK